MEATNFTDPIETVQMISMFSYLNTLSDFLFAKNFLNETNQYQTIPVVNALYLYFLDDDYFKGELDETLEIKKTHLVRILIEGSDLYGAKDNEIPDSTFGDSMYKHIITSLVFDKYTSIYGFLAEIVRNSDDLKVNNLYKRMLSTLSEAKFPNEYGPDSTLEPIAVSKIFQDFILPLFPEPIGDVSLISVDYIYAQAGAIFLRSGETPPIIQPTVYKGDQQFSPFKEYVATAHAVEQSLIAGKIDKSALRIFALPALLHYVYREKENLQTGNIANVILNSTHEAYKLLFSYLKKTFEEIEKAQDNDHRYQFHLAMSNFKNRTSLSREMIERNCQSVKEDLIEHEVLRYKNNPDSYECETGNRRELLPNIKELYQEQINNITRKFFVYERKSIQEAFGEDRIKSMDTAKLIISKGLIVHYYYGSIGLDTAEDQLIKESDDLFLFYFPGNETSVYYALIREDNNVSLIQESDGSEIFRQKLGLGRYQKFRDHYFPSVKKAVEERFDDFITRIAEERANDFKKTLSAEGYDQTKKEWWKEFGLNLIPFYTCRHGIRTKNIEETSIACPLDAIFILPVVGEVGSLIGKLTTVTTRSLLSLAETCLGSMMIRMTLRESLAISGEILANEAAHFSAIFTKELFKDLGLSLFRFLDPGFEFVFTIGKGGLRSIINLINALKKYPISLESLIRMLEKCSNTIANSLRKVDTIFGRDVYVKSLSAKEGSGYGYKRVDVPNNQIVEIRRVREYEEEIPVVFDRVSEQNEKIYKAFSIASGKIKKKDLHLQDEILEETSKSQPIRFKIKSYHDSEFCGSLRSKRSPKEIFCIRNILMNKRKLMQEKALEFTRNHPELSEDTIRSMLSKYIFPGDGSLQLNFVKDWRDLIRKGKSELPAWSKKYEIDDPDLFSRLRFAETLDKKEIPMSEAVSRLNAIYPQNPLYGVSPAKDASSLTEYFASDKAHESVTFEDYVALRNYMGDGYRRIGQNTIEARCMKEALYRLAIRLSDDPIGEFETMLFRGETRPLEVVEKLFLSGKEEIQFNRFTSTSTNKNVAKKFPFDNPRKGSVKILYEMKFSEPFLRAKLQNIVSNQFEQETVLLPGSKFRIDSVTESRVSLVKSFTVKMSFMHDAIQKHEWYKNIMDELEKLKKNKAPSYENDTPRRH